VDLTIEEGEAEDLKACAYLIGRRACAHQVRQGADLCAVWRRLQQAHALQVCVLKDRERPAGERVVAFGMSVFVSDDFMRAARAPSAPFVNDLLFAGVERGDPVALGPNEVRKANSRNGLNLLVLHHAWAEATLSAEEMRRVRHGILTAFFDDHEGYRIKEILVGGSDEVAREWARCAGSVWRTDYAAYYQACLVPVPPPGERPFLMGLTRDEALRSEGSTLARLFVHAPPRFGFRPAEQDVLRRALLRGETDEEIAVYLTISHEAVRKRWHSIYNRVSDHARDLLPAAPAGRENPAGTAARRGTEKRRALLQYLRHHPEELRLWDFAEG
jgi:DNA-binding CsgD family transcriptional regulator